MKKIVEDGDHEREFSSVIARTSISRYRGQPTGYDAVMRGRWIGALLALFAACDDSVWIEIRVPDGLAVDEVELFLAIDHCKKAGEACKGVRPPTTETSVGFVPGTVYEHDRDITFVAKVSDGSASFRLAASSDKLPALMAIGVQGASDRPAVGGVVLAPLDLSLGARHVIATLEPADQRTRVFRWPDPDDPQRGQIGCAGIKHGAEPGTFVVSPGDWDCDGFANEAPVECDPLVYKSASTGQDVDCAESVTRTPGDVCVLGSGACVDGVGGNCQPGPRDLCVPQKLCDDACRSPDCLEQSFHDTPVRIECTFPATRGASSFTVCGPGGRRAVAITLSTADPFPCFGTPGLTADLLDDMPATILDFDADGIPAMLKVLPLIDQTCELGFELGTAAGLGFEKARFALHVPLGNGPANAKMLIPIEVRLMEITELECDAGNGGTATCTAISLDSDSILHCQP
jgi:hypothetical protein